jgi:hypothetical protein
MSAEEIKAEKERKPKKVELIYRYQGECETCLVPVETLEIDVEMGDKVQHVCVAFCPNCKKQLAYRPVKKL